MAVDHGTPCCANLFREEVRRMTKVSPWHSSKPGIEVYHNNNKCTEGNNIEKKYWTAGTGGKRLCLTCKGLNDAGK